MTPFFTTLFVYTNIIPIATVLSAQKQLWRFKVLNLKQQTKLKKFWLGFPGSVLVPGIPGSRTGTEEPGSRKMTGSGTGSRKIPYIWKNFEENFQNLGTNSKFLMFTKIILYLMIKILIVERFGHKWGCLRSQNYELIPKQVCHIDGTKIRNFRTRNSKIFMNKIMTIILTNIITSCYWIFFKFLKSFCPKYPDQISQTMFRSFLKTWWNKKLKNFLL
jgi:hypothetical protein